MFATAPVGLAFFDRGLRYLKVNDTLAALSGMSPEDHIGRTVPEIIPTLAPEIERELGRVLESGAPSLGRELHGQAPTTGEERFWLTSFYPVRTTEGETVGVGVVIADLTDRVRAERRLAAQYDVTRILSTAETFEAGADQILGALCERLDLCAAGFWSADDEHDTLRLERDFAIDSEVYGPFIQAGRELELEKGAGLPGRVWATGETDWIPDLRKDPNFRRAEAAEACGLRSGLGFPSSSDRDSSACSSSSAPPYARRTRSCSGRCRRSEAR